MRYKKSASDQGPFDIVPETSSFRGLSEEDINGHLRIRRYGDFMLTQGISPAYDLRIRPQSGYRRSVYKDQDGQSSILVISASQEKILDLFFELAPLVGPLVDAFAETSHENGIYRFFEDDGFSRDCDSLISQNIDTSVASSIFTEFDDLLLNDGCTGVALANFRRMAELHFDNHKLIIFYGWKKTKELVLQTLARFGIAEDKSLEPICDAEHIHSTTPDFKYQFDQLVARMSAIQWS